MLHTAGCWWYATAVGGTSDTAYCRCWWHATAVGGATLHAATGTVLLHTGGGLTLLMGTILLLVVRYCLLAVHCLVYDTAVGDTILHVVSGNYDTAVGVSY